MFKPKGMVPRTTLDRSKVDSTCSDDDNVEVFTGSRGWLFVHGKVHVEG